MAILPVSDSTVTRESDDDRCWIRGNELISSFLLPLHLWFSSFLCFVSLCLCSNKSTELLVLRWLMCHDRGRVIAGTKRPSSLITWRCWEGGGISTLWAFKWVGLTLFTCVLTQIWAGQVGWSSQQEACRWKLHQRREQGAWLHGSEGIFTVGHGVQAFGGEVTNQMIMMHVFYPSGPSVTVVSFLLQSEKTSGPVSVSSGSHTALHVVTSTLYWNSIVYVAAAAQDAKRLQCAGKNRAMLFFLQI